MNSELSMNVMTHTSEHRATRLSGLAWACIAGAIALFSLLIYDTYFAAGHDVAENAAEAAHDLPPIWACIPFAGILLCIAVLPLIPATAHWWESNKNRLLVSLVFAAMTLIYYSVAEGLATVPAVLEHALVHEYIPFIVLLFSLYVISGGISLRGDIPAHPTTNTLFIGIGALLASFIGTTGASMLLIRPLLQTNSERKHVRHTVIFFIFLVSNVGGCLLPIGDPPLFLGYLRGVHFLWTLKLALPWAVTSAILLVIYFAVDCWAYRHEAKPDIQLDETRRVPLTLTGKANFLCLLGVVFAVALLDPTKDFLNLGLFRPFPLMREFVMLAFVVLSLKITPKGVRQANRFNYHAILEVAALFVGIFICMQVPIEILHAKGAQLGLSEPWHFFWATGALSSFLDNAPTYVVFFETAKVLPAGGAEMVHLAANGAIAAPLLAAVSLGSVFMGAMTYIGNGPNFMVKSIAEQSRIKMPSFFGYMLWSVGILGPVLILVTFLFL